jgi:hypothetical protein
MRLLLPSPINIIPDFWHAMIPTEDIRTNLDTFAVPTCLLPAVSHFMHDAFPNEPYDPHFYGQPIVTMYYDTKDFDLRRARNKGDRSITLRIRQYPGRTLAVSAKTEEEKYRAQTTKFDINQMPAHLQARVMEIAGNKPPVPVVTVYTRRHAMEDNEDRFTLDADVQTDLGISLPFAVLEFKSNEFKSPPAPLLAIGLKPIKLSKFLWATKR